MVPQVAAYRARSTTLAHGMCDAPVGTRTVTHASCAAVLCTSDLTAYSNMYLVEVGEFDELPDLE